MDYCKFLSTCKHNSIFCYCSLEDNKLQQQEIKFDEIFADRHLLESSPQGMILLQVVKSLNLIIDTDNDIMIDNSCSKDF